MKTKIIFFSVGLAILMILLPIATNALQTQQINFTEHPDVLVLEIGHSEATDLATKVISENLLPKSQDLGSNQILVPATNFGTLVSSNSILQNKAQLNNIKYDEVSLNSVQNYLTPYKSILTIVVAHGLANGQGISDGVNSMNYSSLLPMLTAHSEYVFFASCNSSIVNSMNSHSYGFPGIVDATVAGLVASVWAYNSFGLINTAKSLFTTLFNKDFSLILSPINPLTTISLSWQIVTTFFLSVTVAMLAALALYAGLGINAIGAEIISFVVNYYFGIMWSTLTGVPFIGWVFSLFNWAEGLVATIVSGALSAVLSTAVNVATGDLENVASTGSTIFMQTMKTILTGSLISHTGSTMGLVLNFLALIFNFGGQMVGTSNVGNYLNSIGALSTIAADLATMYTLQNAVDTFENSLKVLGASTGLTDVLAGTVVGAEAYSIMSALTSVVSNALNLASKYMHLNLYIDVQTFWGIPTGLTVSGNFNIDRIF